MRASQVATLTGGVLEGDGDQEIVGLAPLALAQAGSLSFLGYARHFGALGSTQTSCLLTTRKLWQQSGCSRTDLTCIFVDDTMWAVALVSEVLVPQHPQASPYAAASSMAAVHPTAEVHPTATLGAFAVVEARAVVGPHAAVMAHGFVGQDARIGAHTVLHPGAKVLWGCVVGDRCILHANAVVGADGFGFAKNPQGADRKKVPQLGTAILGDDVEVGANSTIDRATFGATTLGSGCKIDNLVQIAHNVTLGAHCVVAAQSGIAGSTSLGDSVTVGAQVGIIGHIQVAAHTILAARTGVISTLKEPGVYSGAPAMEHRSWLRMVAASRDLVSLRKQVQKLCKETPAGGGAP